jgi:hypothetical protein
MSTTTLYETTQQTGTVSSANSTSLYSNTTDFTTGLVNSSVYSVNGGLGVTVNPTTGNVVVSIGQDVATTANVTFANITATGNLSNAYYTLANAAGTNGQVLTTNGAGVTTWTTPSSLGLVSSVTGSGAGISVSPTTGAVVVSNTGVTSAVAGTGIGVSAGTGAVTFNNTGVTSAVAGTGISVSAGTGAVTITNSGVTSIVAGSNISISGGTGAVTINAVGFGSGDVTGPASATDNAIVRFDGTTGKLIQNSTVTIADTTGDITTNGDIAVNGGDITTLAGGIANLYNNNAVDTINIGNGVVTEVNIGNVGSGRVFAKTPSFETASNATVGNDLTVNGGNINLNGVATAGVMPFLTFQTQADGVNSLYGVRGKSALNDAWLVGSGSAGSDQGYLELATGDNAGTPGNGGEIYARQYNNGATAPFGVPWEGGTGTVVNEFILLDDNGDTSIPNNLTVGGTISAEGITFDLATPVHQGQMLYVSDDVTPTITNSSTIITNDATYRPVFQYDNATAGVSTSVRFRKNFTNGGGTGAYTTGDGTGIAFQLDSDTQTTNQIANITTAWDAAAPVITLSTNINDNTTGPFISVGTFSTVDAAIPASLTLASRSSIESFTQTTTSTSTIALATSTRTAMSVLVTAVQGANTHVVNATILRNGATAMLTTYGEMYNNTSLVSFTADVSGGLIRLLITPASATSTVFNAVRTSLN